MTKKLCVLVVDDDERLRSMLAQAVATLGHSAVMVGDGSEAVRFLAANSQVDGVITDYQMPEMDGLQLIQWLAAELDGPPPTLLHSGYDQLTFREKGETRTIPLTYASEVFPFVRTHQKPTSLKVIRDFLAQV